MSDFDKLQVRKRMPNVQLAHRTLNQNNQQQFRQPMPQIPSEYSNTEQQGIALRYYFKVLNKNKWIILILVGLITGSVWYLLKNVQPLYEASAVIQIDPEKIDVLENKTVLYQNWLDPEYYNTQLKLLTNQALIKQVALDMELDKNPEFASNRPTTLNDAFYQLLTSRFRQSGEEGNSVNNDQNKDADPLTPLAGTIVGNLQVAPIPKTRLVRITYRHHSPKLAQKLVNTLSEVFIRNNLVQRTSASKASSVFLQKRLSELQTEIQTAEQQLIDYGKSHAIVSLDADQNTVVERLAGLNRQLLDVEAIRKEAEASYKLSQGTSADAVPEVLASATIRGIQDRLSTLRQKRLELLTTFTEEWPEVKQTTQTIAQLERELQAEKSKIINGLETRYRTAMEREKLLRGDFDRQMGTTLKQNESAVNYKIKQQEVDTRKELYKNILVQLKQADISSSSDVNNITLSTPANQPNSAVSPRYGLTMTMAFFCSLVGALGLAFVRDYLSTKINSVEDVDRFVNLPTLGLIPEFKPEFTSKPVIELLSAESESTSSDDQQLQIYNSNNGLSAFKTPDSAVAEAYRHLRTSMILAPGMQHNKAILVTSGQPGEGKSTTASNIAIALAHTGARTVIIDADLRKPSLHLTFNLEESHDLGQYLSGYAQMEDLFNKTAIPNLTVISSNNPMPPLYPAELLGSPRMRDLIAYCRNTRDYLIIDSPPILPFADAAILSAEVDGVLLVVNAEFSRREVVQRARRMLEEIGANLIGVVLNNVSQEKTSYGGYYRYGYKYRNQSSDSIFQRVVDTLRKKGGNNSAGKNSNTKTDTRTATVNIKAKDQQFEVSVEKDEKTTKTIIVDQQTPLTAEAIAAVVSNNSHKPATVQTETETKIETATSTAKPQRKIKTVSSTKPLKKKSVWKTVSVSFNNNLIKQVITTSKPTATSSVKLKSNRGELSKNGQKSSEQTPEMTEASNGHKATEVEIEVREQDDLASTKPLGSSAASSQAGTKSQNHQDRKWRKRKNTGKITN